MIARGRVLVADDDASVRFVLSKSMAGAGHDVFLVEDGTAAIEAIERESFDVALVDVRMPGKDGFAVLDAARAKDGGPAVILLTALDEGKHAIEAMKRGAWDYLAKPFDVDEVEILVSRAIEARRLTDEVKRLRGGDPAAEPGTPDSGIVGKSRAMREVFKAIGKVAPSLETVLVVGPSGSGKELVARAIHAHSPRASFPFVAVNCAAIPSELLESELFGAARGAYTGAVADRAGRFQSARGGTLFLDEIGELPRPLQAKLLRAVQAKEINPLGSTTVVKTDVRLIAATNADLEELVASGAFREDLFYRLRVVEIELPPLEDRRDDIPLLAEHFAARAAHEAGVPAKTIAPAALTALSKRRWPGNVRELENAVRRAVISSRGDTIGPSDFDAPPPAITAEEEGSFEELVKLKLGEFVTSAEGSADLHDRVLALVERPLIELALQKTGGNRVKAAKLLGLNRNTLAARIKALAIEEGSDPAPAKRRRK